MLGRVQQKYEIYHISPVNCQNWETNLINKLMNLSIQIWKTCNEYNNQNSNQCKSYNYQRRNSTITYLYYKHKSNIQELDSHLFKNQLQEILKFSLSYKIKWIKSI